jgi:hypothetical protein
MACASCPVLGTLDFVILLWSWPMIVLGAVEAMDCCIQMIMVGSVILEGGDQGDGGHPTKRV